MYCDLLATEIQQRTSNGAGGFVEPQIQSEIPLDIKESYIENMSTRIDYYYRIGRASDLKEVVEIEKNLIDVFGPIPTPTQNLLLSSRLRIIYTDTPVSNIYLSKSSIQIIIKEVDEKRGLDFLAAAGSYEDPNLSHLQFKKEGPGKLKVVLFFSDGGRANDLAFSFVRLFGRSG